jgi:hypothetical protein
MEEKKKKEKEIKKKGMGGEVNYRFYKAEEVAGGGWRSGIRVKI